MFAQGGVSQTRFNCNSPVFKSFLACSLKGPSQLAKPLFLFICESSAIIFDSEHVESKQITVKLLKITNFQKTQLTEKQYDFASPCNINNFDSIENGGD